MIHAEGKTASYENIAKLSAKNQSCTAFVVNLHFVFNWSMHAPGGSSCWVRKNTGKARSWDHRLRQFQCAIEIILFHGDRWNWAHRKSDDSDPLRCFFLHWIQEPHEFDSSTLALRGPKKLYHKCWYPPLFFSYHQKASILENVISCTSHDNQSNSMKQNFGKHLSIWNVIINSEQEYSSGTLFPGGGGFKY